MLLRGRKVTSLQILANKLMNIYWELDGMNRHIPYNIIHQRARFWHSRIVYV